MFHFNSKDGCVVFKNGKTSIPPNQSPQTREPSQNTHFKTRCKPANGFGEINEKPPSTTKKLRRIIEKLCTKGAR